MNIQPVTASPFPAEVRRPAFGPASDASFREQLSAAGAQTQKTPPPAAAPSTDTLLSALFRLKVQQMDAGRELTEEREDWDRLMDRLDAWIESLQEDGNIEKSARAYAVWSAAHTDTPAVKKGAASACLFEIISSRFSG